MVENVVPFGYIEKNNDLFYDVETDKTVKNIIGQANSTLSAMIEELVETLTRLDEKGNHHKDEDNSITSFVIIMFVRKIIELTDAINELYAHSIFIPSQVVLRSLLENVVYLGFILEDDTDYRAAAFFLQHHFEEMEMAKNIFDDSGDGCVIEDVEIREKFKYDCKRKEQALNHLISNNSIYKKVADKRRELPQNKNVKWYQECDVQNFRELMEKVDLGRYYKSLYGSLSFETHALNTAQPASFEEDVAVMHLIRSPNDGENTFSLTCTFCTFIISRLYEYMDVTEPELSRFKSFFVDFIEHKNIAANNLNKIIVRYRNSE